MAPRKTKPGPKGSGAAGEATAGVVADLSLSDVVAAWQLDVAETRHDADIRAARHLSLYPRDQIGLLYWYAYYEYRSRGLQVPEAILEKFDEWVTRLRDASGSTEVAVAIEMVTNRKGGAQGAARVTELLRNQAIATEVHRMLQMYAGRKSATEVYTSVAKEFNLSSWRRAQNIYSEWKLGPNRRQR